MGKYVDPNFKKLPKATQDRIRKANPPGSQPDPGPGGLGRKLHRWLTKDQQPNE